jgi:uncharacterized protein (TIGR02246 family)
MLDLLRQSDIESEKDFFVKLKSCLSLAVLLLTMHAASAQQAGDAQRDAALKEVRAVWDRETEGWAKFDPKIVASCYTGDAIWQNPFGVRLHGSAQIEKFLTNLFARPGYRTAKDTIPAKILDIRLESDTVAAVWADESSVGQINDATGKPMDPRYSYYVSVYVKTPAGWKVRESLIADQIK